MSDQSTTPKSAGHDTPRSGGLEDLLARVEAATGGDAVIDLDLWCATAHLHQLSTIQAPFTRSLDAALALVERVLPGWDVQVKSDDGEWRALVAIYQKGRAVGLGRSHRNIPNPALALLAALLRALISKALGTSPEGLASMAMGGGDSSSLSQPSGARDLQPRCPQAQNFDGGASPSDGSDA